MKRNWQKNLTALLILSQLGSGVLSFVLSWSVLRTTGSALSFSQVIVPSSIIGLISAYPVGKIVDKYSKNKLMMLAQLCSVLALAVFGLFRYTHADAYLIASIITLNVCLSICDEVISASLLAAGKQIVNSEDELGSYNSLSQTVRGICSLIAPLIGGAVFKLFSITTFVLIEIVIESICVFYIYNIKLVNEVTVTEETTEADLSFRDMLAFLRKKKIIVQLSICMLFLNLLLGSMNVGYPFIISNNFNDKPFLYGLINFATPVGMLAASISYQVLKPGGSLVKQAVYAWSVAAFVIMFIGAATLYFDLRTYAFAFVLILSSFIIGFSVSFSHIPEITYAQKVVPSNLQGRIFALLDALAKAAIPVSLLLYGILFDNFNLSLIYLVSGLIVFIYMIFMVIYVNRLQAE